MNSDIKELRKEFIEKLRRKMAAQVTYVVERNVEPLLLEIEKQHGLAADDIYKDGKDEEMIITIKLGVVHPSYLKASTHVRDITWIQRTKYRDGDFPLEEIDIVQPEIPGLLAAEKSPDVPADAAGESDAAGEMPEEMAPSDGTDATYQAMCEYSWENLANLRGAANDLHCRIFVPCQDETVANWERTIVKYENGIWSCHLIPADVNMASVLEDAAVEGNIVFDLFGCLEGESIRALFKYGYEVWNASPDGGVGFVKSIDSVGTIKSKAKVFTKQEVAKFLKGGGILLRAFAEE